MDPGRPPPAKDHSGLLGASGSKGTGDPWSQRSAASRMPGWWWSSRMSTSGRPSSSRPSSSMDSGVSGTASSYMAEQPTFLLRAQPSSHLYVISHILPILNFFANIEFATKWLA